MLTSRNQHHCTGFPSSPGIKEWICTQKTYGKGMEHSTKRNSCDCQNSDRSKMNWGLTTPARTVGRCPACRWSCSLTGTLMVFMVTVSLWAECSAWRMDPSARSRISARGEFVFLFCAHHNGNRRTKSLRLQQVYTTMPKKCSLHFYVMCLGRARL